MTQALAHFDALTRKGLKIIPLRENSKVPLCKGWSQEWDWHKNREKLRQFPEANLGVLLGDIVDVEGDSEEANRTIGELIGDYPHPCYFSTKSVHHLFATPDRHLSHFRYGEIEFRGHGHQSVIPPSQHQGIFYRWLSAFRFPIPSMPERLLAFYQSKRNKKKAFLKPDHVRIWCERCKKECFLHRKRLDLELEAFRLLCSGWNCHKCRSVDLRPACRLIRSGLCEKIVRKGISTLNAPTAVEVA
jgi:hypothetical protein